MGNYLKGGEIYKAATPKVATTNEVFTFRGALTAAGDTTAGAVLTLTNETGIDLLVTKCIINVKTAATTATNAIDVGVAATVASNDTLIDGVAAAAGVKNSFKHAGTNGIVNVKWTAGKYLTATASGDLAGMVADYIIEAIAL